MNIIQVTGAPAAGGAEVYVRDLSEGLVKREHRVMVLFISHARDIGLSSQFEEDYLSVLEGAGVEYDFLELHYRKNFLLGGMRLREIVRGFQADVVHTHLYYAAIYSFLSHVKVIYTHHNIVLRVPNAFYRILMNRIVDQYVGICEPCAKVLAAASAKDVVKIYNGVSTDRLTIKSDYEQGKRVKFIAVGRITEQKGYEIMLEAVAKVRKITQKPFKLDIVGEAYGEYSEEIKNLAERLGLIEDGVVEFLGCRTDVPCLFSKADVFVMSSRWEGLPISQIEAALTGVPMIVTNVGGCAEVVDLAQCGLVVDSEDVEALVAALVQMIESYDYRKQCSANALAFASDFSIENAVSKHSNLYQKVINK